MKVPTGYTVLQRAEHAKSTADDGPLSHLERTWSTCHGWACDQGSETRLADLLWLFGQHSLGQL